MAIFTDVIQLQDETSAPAKKAQQELTVLSKALESVQKGLIKAQALGDIKGVQKLTAQSTQLEAALSVLPPVTEEAGSGLAEMAAGLGAVAGVALAAVAAVAAVAVGIGAIIFKGAELAISANEAKGKMVALFDALGDGKTSGAATLSMLDELGDSIGQTREKLAPLAQGFMTLGITGTDRLKELTLAAASAGAIAEGGAEAFTKLYGRVNEAAVSGQKLTIPFPKLVTSLKAAGLNTQDLASRMGMTSKALEDGLKAGTVSADKFADALQDAATDKGAGPLQKAGASLGNVWKKFTENINKMFEDIDVGPFLDQVKSLFDIFGQAQPSGQALKAGIGGFFKEVFATATNVVPYIKHFLLDIVIWGLQAYIGLKPIIGWFKDLANNATVVTIVKEVFMGLAVAAGIVVGVIALVIANMIVVAAAAGLVVGAVVGIAVAITSFVADSFTALVNWVAQAPQAASDFIAGLVNGITAGAAGVVSSVTNLAGGAVDAFKGALGIHSPSKVMMELGGHTATGFAMGVEDGAPDVHGAASGLAGAAASGAASGAASAGGKGGGVVFNININGGTASAKEIAEEIQAISWEQMGYAAGL